ncbi:MAG TPA: hypothetical protein VI461_04210 [Chitinophagaceae bacterium]|nr:hypothetical protein [Chitinophagaceae bacterium]
METIKVNYFICLSQTLLNNNTGWRLNKGYLTPFQPSGNTAIDLVSGILI